MKQRESSRPAPNREGHARASGEPGAVQTRGRAAGILLLALAAIASGLAGCGTGKEGDRSRNPAPDAPTVAQAPLRGRPTERISAKAGLVTEWRDAVRFGGGSDHTFTLQGGGAGSVLRLGLRDTEGSPVDVRIAARDGDIREFRSAGSGDWQDWRIAQEDADARPGPHEIRLRSKEPFWVGTLEALPGGPPPGAVIVVLVDTLRQDHLGSYGYDRPTSPNIDAFARDAVRLTGLVPSSSWTRPSVASLLTSTYPSVHGAEDRGDRVRDGLPWLGASFRDAGFETRAIMTNTNILPVWGFGGDFQRFVDLGTEQWFELDDRQAVERAEQALRDARGRPLFLYLHALAPHEPYTPPEPFKTRFADASTSPTRKAREHRKSVDLYDAEIAYFDSLFGELVQTLRETGLYDRSTIVLLSDHGEEFWEHGGTSHGKTLYEEQLRVPLLIKLPRGAHAGESHDDLIEMVDVAPTLAELAGVPLDPRFQGRSFVGLFEGRDWGRDHGYASLRLDDKSLYASRTASFKYIRDVAAGSEQWYDLTRDPEETTPLAVPPEGAGSLEGYARSMEGLGKTGLHLMITHDSTRSIEVSGEITASALGAVSLHYPAALSRKRVFDGTFRFSVSMPEAANPRRPSAQWGLSLKESASFRRIVQLLDTRIATEQDHAELVASLPPGGSVAVRIEIDGRALPAESVYAGSAGEHVALDGNPIDLTSLRAAPLTYDPAALPTRTAVYLWYVPPPEVVREEDLDPSLRKSLRALGYLRD